MCCTSKHLCAPHGARPGYIDQNVFGLQSTAKKNVYHFMKNCNASTHQPAHKQGSKNLLSNTRQGGSKRKVLVAKVAV